MDSKIRIAIQKSGRLSEDSLQLFKESGIKFNNGIKKLMTTSHNFPVEFLFLRDDDIPQYVEDGVADIGFVGENVVYEKNKNRPKEICNTLQPHAWGYDKRNDGKHKTAEELVQIVKDTWALNANLLMN